MFSISKIAFLIALSSALGFSHPADTAPKRISLWNGRAPLGNGQYENADAWITLYRPLKPNGAAIVICPGGAYTLLATEPEGHKIAKWLNNYGITGVVLEYRLPKGRWMVPLLDAQCALRVVRQRATEWKLDPDRIGIMGFSAGGHLASTAATHSDKAHQLVLQRRIQVLYNCVT